MHTLLLHFQLLLPLLLVMVTLAILVAAATTSNTGSSTAAGSTAMQAPSMSTLFNFSSGNFATEMIWDR